MSVVIAENSGLVTKPTIICDLNLFDGLFSLIPRAVTGPDYYTAITRVRFQLGSCSDLSLREVLLFFILSFPA